MKEIKVSDECANMIEAYKDTMSIQAECEYILDALYDLNYMLNAGKDVPEVGTHANSIHKAMDMLLNHYKCVKTLAYSDKDHRRDGEVQVTQAE